MFHLVRNVINSESLTRVLLHCTVDALVRLLHPRSCSDMDTDVSDFVLNAAHIGK